MLPGMPNLYSFRMAAAAEQSAGQARRTAADVRRDVGDMERRLDSLTLACVAMWTLLQEKTGLTEDDLTARMKQIDLADGQADGKVTRTVKQCGRCGRAMSPRHANCLYCGSRDLTAGAFDAAR